MAFAKMLEKHWQYWLSVGKFADVLPTLPTDGQHWPDLACLLGWFLIGSYGSLYILVFMGPYGSLLDLMGLYGSLWVFMGLYGSLWVLMGPYGSLCVLIGHYGSL